MELLVVVLAVSVVFTAIGVALPSWWVTALPSMLFAGAVVAAFATGMMEGEGGWAMGVAFLVAAPFVLVATACVAGGVTVGKVLYRRLRGPASVPPPPPRAGAVRAVPSPVAPERPLGS